jgi:hypothetical protein
MEKGKINSDMWSTIAALATSSEGRQADSILKAH